MFSNLCESDSWYLTCNFVVNKKKGLPHGEVVESHSQLGRLFICWWIVCAHENPWRNKVVHGILWLLTGMHAHHSPRPRALGESASVRSTDISRPTLSQPMRDVISINQEWLSRRASYSTFVVKETSLVHSLTRDRSKRHCKIHCKFWLLSYSLYLHCDVNLMLLVKIQKHCLTWTFSS